MDIVDIGERSTLINEGLSIPRHHRIATNSRHPINDLTNYQPFHNKPIPNLIQEYRQYKKINAFIVVAVALVLCIFSLSCFVPKILQSQLPSFNDPSNIFVNVTLDFTIVGSIIGGLDLLFISSFLIYFLRPRKRKEMMEEESSLQKISDGDYIAVWKITDYSQWKTYIDHHYGVNGWPFKPFTCQTYGKYFILYLFLSSLVFAIFSFRLIISDNIWIFPRDSHIFNYILAAFLSLLITFGAMLAFFLLFIAYNKYHYHNAATLGPFEFIIRYTKKE